VTVEGGVGQFAVYSVPSIMMNDFATLTMINNAATEQTNTFEKASATSTYLWKLTGATTTNPLNAASVDISVAAGATGTVEREPGPVCAIGATEYTTIDAALVAVDDDETIRLLTDVTLSGLVDPWLPIDNGMTFTFDTNGFTLDFNDYGLAVFGGSKVNFVGCTEFDNLAWLDTYDDGSKVEFDSDLVFYQGYLYAEDDVVVIVFGSLTTLNDDGVRAFGGASVTINGDIVAKYDGVEAYDSGTIVTVNGDIYAGVYGVYAEGGANVTVNGDIDAGWDGVWAYNGSTVTINGSIEADNNGVYADGATVTVTGGITAGYDGVYISSGSTTVVVVDGEINAGENGVFIDSWDGLTRNATVTVNSDIFAGYAGVWAWYCEDCIVTVNGNIEAAYVGVFAWNGVEVFINGDIVVTENAAPSLTEILAGVAAGFGAEVTVDGTITVLEGHYIALYFEDASSGLYSYIFVEPNENVSSSKASFLEYNDSDELQLVSTVWVKDPATLVPGTGDSTTLWLLLGALMVAALGTGLVLAHRRREQEV